MASENFEAIMEHVFRSEGGYVDHPSDPGGATNMGITIGTLRAWRGGAVTKADVRALSKEEARQIYRKNYWDAVSGDELPSGVDLCTMDSAVNSGVSRGARWLQRAVGSDPDGQIGVRTLAAADAADPAVTIDRMCDDRMNFLRGLRTWPTFGTGWKRRVDSVRAEAHRLRQAVPAPLPTPSPRPTPEEVHDANAEPWYRSRVTWGAIVSALVPILATAGVATDWIDEDTLIAGLVAGGGAIGAIITLYGRWAARKPIGS